MNKIVEYAKIYANLGWFVFPLYGIKDGRCTCSQSNCKSSGKHPRLSDWQNKATRDIWQIDLWWKQWPDSNIGIATESSQLLVLDIDVKGGGLTNIDLLEHEHGKLPPTPTVQTGGGGRHYYFIRPKQGAKSVNGLIASGIDVKCDGGLVVAPPSFHISKNQYVWQDEEPNEIAVSECPEWILSRVKPDAQPSNLNELIRNNNSWRGDKEVPEGQRNSSMISFVGWMIDQGGTFKSFHQRASEANQTYCNPPLDTNEVSYLVNSAIKRWAPKESQKEGVVKPIEYYQNHAFRAKEFRNEYVNQIAYVPEQSIWAAYANNTWQMKPQTEIVHIVPSLNKLNEKLWGQIDEMEGARKTTWVRWAKKCSNAETFTSVIKQARSLLSKSFYDFNTDDYLLNCKNGIVNLKTSELLKHDPKYAITQQASIAYDPNCECKYFLEFLEDITDNNADLILYLQKLVGYCLTGSIAERSIFIFYGHGRNGKSTFLRILLDLMGDYAQSTATKTFTERNNDTIRNDLAGLHDARLVTTSELGKNGILDSTLIKEITGGDPISCRFLYRETFTYLPKYKLIMAVNQRPNLSVKDQAIWDRVHLVPFTVRISEEKVVPQEELLARFKEEMPGIMAWAIEGAKKWQTEKLMKPSIVEEAITDYKEDIDPNSLYLETRFTGQLDDAVPCAVLFEDYRYFAQGHGFELLEGFDAKRFGKTIMKKFKSDSKKIDGKTTKVYFGFKLPN
jgi:putative DNA primase/helicase